MKALLVAFHFPPLAGSSGLQRTVGIARYLPENGWQPIVLTAKETAYPRIDESHSALIPEGTLVERATCFDASRHFSIFGRYPSGFAIPDRWKSWYPFAVRAGLSLIAEHRPSVIWSTYPIATAHRVASRLSQKTGIPWVADFRDPMVEYNSRMDYFAPRNETLRERRLSIESDCVKNASALVFCTDGARDICLERYPSLDAGRCHIIANGYDESAFKLAEDSRPAVPETAERTIRLLHSGTIYPTADRDPTLFFDAVAKLAADGVLERQPFKIVLRATGHDAVFAEMVAARGLGDIVELAPPVNYIDALTEMLAVDVLLIFQGYTSNPAIPAKLYEYLRANRPILGMVDEEGSTARLLHRVQRGPIVRIDDSGDIARGLLEVLSQVSGTPEARRFSDDIAGFSRQNLTKQLAGLFESVLPAER